MAMRLVGLALLFGTSAALAFNSTKVGQWGSLYLDDLSPVLAKSAQLKREVTAALARKNKKPEDILCFGMRFPGPWKNLGGMRVAPYTCDFDGKYLRIDATVRVIGRGGRTFETINDTAMKRATDVREDNLTWKWTTGDDPAKGPPWSVPFAPTAPPEDQSAFLGAVKDSANQILLYLHFAAKTGQKPDFSGPPGSDLFAQVFDLRQLAALPPPKPDDVPVLAAWIDSANQVAKAIIYFGITAPADPIADQDAIKRNVTDFEDQQAAAFNFLIRITAREVQSLFLFMERLAPEQRTQSAFRRSHHARLGLKDRQRAHAQRRDPRHGRCLGCRHIPQGPGRNHARDRHRAERNQRRRGEKEPRCVRRRARGGEVAMPLRFCQACSPWLYGPSTSQQMRNVRSAVLIS